MKAILTVEELRTEMETVKGAPVDDNQIIWFICIQEARAVSDMTLKEIANMFLKGCTPVTIEYVQEWLDNHYSDIDFEDPEQLQSEYLTEVNKNLHEAITNFFRKP